MDKQLLETYSDYLMSSFSYTTATGLSMMVEGEISHDKITRFLGSGNFNSIKLWEKVKSTVRQLDSAEGGEKGVLIIDDTIEEKPSTDENEIVNWYFDHSKGRVVKGINYIATPNNERGS